MAAQDGTNQDQTVDPGIDDRLQTHAMSETLARLKECSLFYEMINKSGLHSTLGHSGLYTLLSPDNAALGNNTPGDPQQFLERHLLSGAMRSDDLQSLQTVKTVAGTTLPVHVQGARVQVGNAVVQRADIPRTNGVIHVIGANLSSSGS